MFDIRKIQEQVLLANIAKESDEVTAKKVVYGPDGNTEQQDDETWVNSTMKRLEETFTEEKVKNIRMGCQCGYGMEDKVNLVKSLMEDVSNLEELGNLPKAHEAGLFFQEGTLYLQFLFCPCPMLMKVHKLDSKTWCQCTTGYSKVLFEQAFQCKVDVELCKSIKAGDDLCLMKIIPEKDPFQIKNEC
jgi:hypothetical protein